MADTNLGFGGFDMGQQQFGWNPAVKAQATAMGNQFNQQLTQNVLPQIGAGAQLAGGFGGSRQGVAEGNAIGQMSQSFGNSMANLFGNAYNADQNFYTQQRGQDLQQQGLGADMFNKGFAGNLGIGQQTFTLGQQYMNAPAQTAQTYGNTIAPFTGLGATTTSSGSTNNSPWAGALGGSILGAQMQNGWTNGFGSK
jgi:hypothetical protein